MIVKPNWNNFKAKFNENSQENFEWFCYFLFCKEYNQLYGIHRYKNQSGIETDPIEIGDEVIGWQAKFYEDTLSNYKDKLLSTLTKTKRDNPNITKLIFYTNSEWGQGKKTKEPQAKIDAENRAKELNINLVWRTGSYFESPFVCQEQKEISRYFFELNSKRELTPYGFLDILKDRYENTFQITYNELNRNNIILEREIEEVSDFGKNRKVEINRFLTENNKSLIIAKEFSVKKNFYKYIAYLWSKGEIYQNFEYVIYLSLKKWKNNGLKGLIRDNYYSLDDKFITLDIKSNSHNILFLFDDIDGLDFDKRNDLQKEIDQYNLLHYSFTILNNKERIKKEFHFDKYLELSFIRTDECEKKEHDYKIKVFHFFKREFNFIDKGISEKIRISLDKKLYSENIENYRTFDIVIEGLLPLKSLLVAKCFDNVSLEDIQNFYNQAKEVNANKMIIISSKEFDKNIIRQAEKKTNFIALLYYKNDTNNEWILRRSFSSFISIKKDIKQSFRPRFNTETSCSFYGFSNGKYIESPLEFIINLLIENSKSKVYNFALLKKKVKKNFIKVEFLDDSKINQIVHKILFKINYKGGFVDLEKITSFLEKENNLKVYYHQALAKDVLGEIDFEQSLIMIDDYQCKILPRKRFTVAHEIGHYLLGHGYYMYREKFTIRHEDNIGKNIINEREIAKMEYQANKFASFLLLPIDSFRKDLISLLKEYDVRDKGFGQLFVDNQKCNIEVFMKITNRLMHKYKVSRQVIEIRLKI